jgi:phage gp46-like protein
MGDYQTNTNQQGDVLLYHGPEDCGEINEADGIIQMTQFYETMAYLALFGGNQEDDGSAATEKLQWWGNEDEPEERQYRGRFQARLSGAPLTSASILDLEADAKYDLESVFLPDYAASVSVSASIVAPKMVHFEINIEAKSGEVYSMEFEAAA